MVCDDVKRVAYFFLDDTLGAEKKREFEQHLGDCPGCEDRVSLHRRLRYFIVNRLERVSAPPRLRKRLASQLNGFRS